MSDEWRESLEKFPLADALSKVRSLIKRKQGEITQALTVIENKKHLIASLTESIKSLEEFASELPIKDAQRKLLPEPLPKPSANRCSPPCGKLRFNSKQKATRFNASNDKAIRVYFSINCNCYHVTRAE